MATRGAVQLRALQEISGSMSRAQHGKSSGDEWDTTPYTLEHIAGCEGMNLFKARTASMWAEFLFELRLRMIVNMDDKDLARLQGERAAQDTQRVKDTINGTRKRIRDDPSRRKREAEAAAEDLKGFPETFFFDVRRGKYRAGNVTGGTRAGHRDGGEDHDIGSDHIGDANHNCKDHCGNSGDSDDDDRRSGGAGGDDHKYKDHCRSSGDSGDDDHDYKDHRRSGGAGGEDDHNYRDHQRSGGAGGNDDHDREGNRGGGGTTGQESPSEEDFTYNDDYYRPDSYYHPGSDSESD